MQLPNLRKWRELRGLRQVDLAERVGLSHRSVSNFESGREARPNHARKLAEVLDVDLLVLAGEQEPAHPKGDAPASPSPLSDDDRRTLDVITRTCNHLEERLRAGDMTAEEIEGHAITHEAFARILARLMREEADELRQQHPDVYDLARFAVVGPVAVRYAQVMMEIADVADLQRETQEVYKTAS